ncbi:hypothetical protein ACFXPI_02430 [Streptomyces sp. NPDC059104]|uniref:COG1361 S-layer family protein n=1 Tax=Streptomyces sp. NPDC059104 TaxID=3346729 RepID=UPI0036C95A35
MSEHRKRRRWKVVSLVAAAATGALFLVLPGTQERAQAGEEPQGPVLTIQNSTPTTLYVGEEVNWHPGPHELKPGESMQVESRPPPGIKGSLLSYRTAWQEYVTVRVTHGEVTCQAERARLACTQDETGNDIVITSQQPHVAPPKVTSQADKPRADRGDEIAYTVTAENPGPGKLTGVTLMHRVPEGTTLVPNTLKLNGTAYDGSKAEPDAEGRLPLDAGDLPARGKATFSFKAKVKDDAVSNPLGLTPEVEYGAEYYDRRSAFSAPVRTALASADLSVSGAFTPEKPVAGQKTSYEVTVRNAAGGDAARSPELRASVPEGLTDVSTRLDGAKGSCRQTGGEIACGLDALSAGQSAKLTVTGTLDAGHGNRSLRVDAKASASTLDPMPNNNEAVLVASSKAAADLSVDIASSPGTSATAGDAVTYTVRVRNAGPSHAEDVKVAVELPQGLARTGHTAGKGAYYAGTGTWLPGSLGVGETAELKVTATLPADVAEAVARATVSGKHEDPAPDNNTSEVRTTIAQSADVSVEAASDPAGEATAGDSVAYTFTLRNAGPSTAKDTGVSVQLPPGMTLSGHEADRGGFDPATRVWKAGDLPKGGSAKLTVRGLLPADVDEAVATATASSATPDPKPGNNTAGTTVKTRQNAGMSLAMVIDEPKPKAGSTVAYTLKLHNSGPSTAKGVEVTDRMPKGFELLGHKTGAGSFDPGSGIWKTGDIPADTTVELVLTGKLPADITDLTHSAEITKSAVPDGDTMPGDGGKTKDAHRAQVSTPVQQVAGLKTTKEVDDPNPFTGSPFVLTTKVLNQGPSTARNVHVRDLLPPDIEYVSDDSGGAYDPTTGDWRPGDLPSGGEATLDITVTTATTRPLTSQVRYAASDAYDPEPCVGVCAEVEITAKALPDPPETGGPDATDPDGTDPEGSDPDSADPAAPGKDSGDPADDGDTADAGDKADRGIGGLLASTGSTALAVGAGALTLLGAGAGLYWLARRRSG